MELEVGRMIATFKMNDKIESRIRHKNKITWLLFIPTHWSSHITLNKELEKHGVWHISDYKN